MLAAQTFWAFLNSHPQISMSRSMNRKSLNLYAHNNIWSITSRISRISIAVSFNGSIFSVKFHSEAPSNVNFQDTGQPRASRTDPVALLTSIHQHVSLTPQSVLFKSSQWTGRRESTTESPKLEKLIGLPGSRHCPVELWTPLRPCKMRARKRRENSTVDT